MKYLVLLIMLAQSFVMDGQRIFLQLQPEAGISSFTSGILQFEPAISYQGTLQGGIYLNEHSSLQIGFGIQKSGAASTIIYAGGVNPIMDRIYHSTGFIKIPVDFSFRLGSRKIFSLGIGIYYNGNITNWLNQHGILNTDSGYSPINMEDLLMDDIGIRLRPAIEVPYNMKYIISIGLLQELGLNVVFPETHHYNTYLSVGLRRKL